MTYYNGEGTAKPGTLAYYGTQWCRRVGAVKKVLNAGADGHPYVFEGIGYVWEAQQNQSKL